MKLIWEVSKDGKLRTLTQDYSTTNEYPAGA